MLLTTDFERFYLKIKKGLKEGDTILIIVTSTVDSICACQILTVNFSANIRIFLKMIQLHIKYFQLQIIMI